MSLARLALTTGEPAGIGPDLAIILAQNPPTNCEIITIGCSQLLQARAKQLGLSISIEFFDPVAKPTANKAGTIRLLNLPTTSAVTASKLDTANAQYVIDLLDAAISGCQQKTFDAMVTAPVQKSVINDAGMAFSGHTEYLAQQTNTEQVVMMLASDELRVTLATTHLPLRDVADAINETLLKKVITIVNHDLQHYFGIAQPHILVAGLNPHAGENGHLGMEEIDIIEPCINKLKAAGLNLSGPLPADTLFTDKHLKTADAVLTMYHDQGLPVLKYQSFSRACNITLGLPIIRTSVDHGTALDLAGTGNIDTGSLTTAIKQAAIMSVAKNTKF